MQIGKKRRRNMAKVSKNPISRREFLKDAGICAAGCAAVGGAALLTSCAPNVTTETVTTTITSTSPPITKVNQTTVTAAPSTVTVTGPTSTVTATKTASTTITAAPSTVEITMVDPGGSTEIKYLNAPRLEKLDGKTIAILSNETAKWQVHRVLPHIKELLEAKFPTAKVLAYTEFPIGENEINNDATAQLVKDRGCHAAIVGNAG
jgi:hypothetical protein